MIIFGAGSAGIETASVLTLRQKPADIIFFDEKVKQNKHLKGCDIYTSMDELQKHYHGEEFVIAIGHPRLREKAFQKMTEAGFCPGNAIFHSSVMLNSPPPALSLIVHPGVVCSYGSEFGKGCMIHANTVIGHRVMMGNWVSIAPNVSVVGPCQIDDYVFVGAGAIILPHVNIGKQAIIGAGAVVKHDVPDFKEVTAGTCF